MTTTHGYALSARRIDPRDAPGGEGVNIDADYLDPAADPANRVLDLDAVKVIRPLPTIPGLVRLLFAETITFAIADPRPRRLAGFDPSRVQGQQRIAYVLLALDNAGIEVGPEALTSQVFTPPATVGYVNLPGVPGVYVRQINTAATASVSVAVFGCSASD